MPVSVLITDSCKISPSKYAIPSNIAFQDVRVERVILANNWNNVSNHEWTLIIDGSSRLLPIPNGRYSEQEYAAYLQERLTVNSTNINWFVTYNKNVNEFIIRCNNLSDDDAVLLANAQAQKAVGYAQSTTFPGNEHVAFSGQETVNFNPSFCTIRSSSLNQDSYAYKTQTSDIIAFFPLQSEAAVTQWQETSTFLTGNVSNKILNNEIDLRFFIQDREMIEEPTFAIELTFM